mgnify:CR=1 FL=1
MKKYRRHYLTVICAVVVGTFFSVMLSPPLTAAASEEQLLVDKARITFESFMSDSNMSYLKEHLKEAKGILIVPSLLKAGFIFGGSGGSALSGGGGRRGGRQAVSQTQGRIVVVASRAAYRGAPESGIQFDDLGADAIPRHEAFG